MLRTRDALRTLPIYQPPLAARRGLRLDFNENTAGCSPRVLARLRTLTAQEIASYPDRGPIEALVARHLEVDPSELLLTNGIDEAIHLLCEAFLQPGDEVLIVVPTFAMYRISAAATGASVIAVPADDDFRFPTENLLARLTARTRLIAIANPNNPTGAVAEPEDLIKIARLASQAAILVDEAYFEFYGKTLLPQWRDLPNLFIARTFSKAYGLAGLRIGVLAGNSQYLSLVRRLASPYNVNAIALACLPAALEDEAYVRQYVDQVVQGREKLHHELTNCGIRHWPSHANFVLAGCGELKDALVESLRARGILVRDRSHDYGCDGCVRITVGNLDQTSRLLEALRETLAHISLKEAAAK